VSLTSEQEQLLAALHQNLRQDALEPGHPFYVNLRDERYEGAVGEDVVRQLVRDVSWAQPPSVAFFSGFRGAGKSTELNRLRQALSEQGFAVAKFDVESYLDVRYPITAGQLVFAIAAGVWEACVDQGWIDGEDDPQSPFKRLWDWFSAVQVESEVTFTAPLKQWSPVDFSAHLRRDPTFRRQLDVFLRARSVELNTKASEFLTALDDRVRRHFVQQGRDWLGMVVIVDSLDHARSETAFLDVRHAIREVFDLQLPLVRFERFRMVFCVPPYISPAAGTVRRIFNVKTAVRDGSGFEPGVEALADVLTRRLPTGVEPEALFSRGQVRTLIRQSGGHIRDLLRLVDEVILGAESVPVTDRDVAAALVRVRETFLPLSADQKRWLAEIAATHQLQLDDQDAWEGLAELLDYHLVLRYANDEPWYDVHPIIADHVGERASSDGAAVPER
jgi:hypothetical protein